MIDTAVNNCVEADYFYANLTQTGKLLVAGYQENGARISELFIPSKRIKPKYDIRVLATMGNIPAIFALENMFDKPILYGSPGLLMAYAPTNYDPNNVLFNDMVDVIHEVSRGLPPNDRRNFRPLDDTARYQFGLFYHVCRDRMKSYNFGYENVEKVLEDYINLSYTNFAQIKAHHPMGHLFDSQHTLAVDFCAALMDPRMYLALDGTFDYTELTAAFGFNTLDAAARIARMFVSYYGIDKVPYDHDEVSAAYLKMIGHTPETVDMSLSPPQFLGIRVIHRLLVTPQDDLMGKIEYPDIGGGQLNKDVELIKRYFHYFINEWFTKLDIGWSRDPYSSDLFEEKE